MRLIVRVYAYDTALFFVTLSHVLLLVSCDVDLMLVVRMLVWTGAFVKTQQLSHAFVPIHVA